jgi:Na+-transporting NADH:ubiquinone oxidoreductase subunit C
MAINKESNAYTFIFSIIMCVVVGIALAMAAMALKPAQDKNVENEKKQSILSAIQVEVAHKEAENEFDKYVKNALVLDANGKIVSEDFKEAFAISALDQFKNVPLEERKYPLFIAEKEGKKLYVMPVAGQGLWAGVWGYVAVGEDLNTVAGASFAHKSETPGLGAEIETPFFESQFPGKKIHDETGNFTSIRVLKPGGAKTEHTVDGISGGTFTSKGVDEMLSRCLQVYSLYFKSLSTETAKTE